MEFYITMTSADYMNDGENDSYYDVGYHKTYEDAVLEVQKSFYQVGKHYYTDITHIRWVDLDRGLIWTVTILVTLR